MARNTSCIAGASPMISGVRARLCGTSSPCCSWACWLARLTSETASSTSNGLGRYSKAPPWYDATALSRSEWAVMMMTGRRGCCSRICASRSRPLVPGMRMSEMITSGCWRARRPITPSALSKLWVVMPSCCRAFSRTQRMERSSSTIHTVSLRLMRRWLLVPGAGRSRRRCGLHGFHTRSGPGAG
ncbi:hypothetical protein D3C78_446930 [compost metagenome]